MRSRQNPKRAEARPVHRAKSKLATLVIVKLIAMVAFIASLLLKLFVSAQQVIMHRVFLAVAISSIAALVAIYLYNAASRRNHANHS